DELAEHGAPLLPELRTPVPEGAESEAEAHRAAALAERLLRPAPPAFPDLGRLGRYELLARLGAGGMGQVFKARHDLLDRGGALKVLHPRRFDHPEAVRRFRREIQALARLSHPNIVAALDADEDAGTHFLVMEYVEGVTLARHVREHGPLPVTEACDAVVQAAEGLQHAHEHGLVHRDGKPANLSRTPTGRGKLLDLGLVRGRADDADTAPGQVLGPADYMAPEQWDDTRTADSRADLYSLGCTLYFLLTGAPPFGGEAGNLRKMKAHAEAPVPDVRR